MASLEDRIARLEAKDASRALLHAYSRACDTNDTPGVAVLFLPDGELWAGASQYLGRDEIHGFYADRLSHPTCHVVDVTALDAIDEDAVDDDRPAEAAGQVVAAQSTFLSVHLSDEPQLHWGTYVDRIVVRGGQARFASRRITIDGSAPL
jgi:hypothetical protein